MTTTDIILSVIAAELGLVIEFLRRANGIAYGSGYTPWRYKIFERNTLLVLAAAAIVAYVLYYNT